MQRLVGERGRGADVLAGLGAVVLACFRRRSMQARDDIQVFVAAHEHVLPLGERRQSDVGDGCLKGRLLGVLFALRRG